MYLEYEVFESKYMLFFLLLSIQLSLYALLSCTVSYTLAFHDPKVHTERVFFSKETPLYESGETDLSIG